MQATRIRDGNRVRRDEMVAREETLCLHLNGALLVRLICSPSCLEDLAVGFLFSEGIIAGLRDIQSIEQGSAETTLFVRTVGSLRRKPGLAGAIRTSGCGAGVTLSGGVDGIERIHTGPTIGVDQILSVSREFEASSELFRQTGGVHACGLALEGKLTLMREDIGRHNALDKVVGAALREGIDLSKTVVHISGRISSEMVTKAARSRVATVVSRTAPTSTAVDLAAQLGICVVGFVRGGRMNVYTYADRIR
ncbi:MAG: formate dehydrogenase accessory sulfurtransferase FdhD [Candidatus Eisenbacteria sp.]|nr:formate dehydrogenase accessory sulfurtransferase FdhD [Candidatus Eisenbacteria bacterium]